MEKIYFAVYNNELFGTLEAKKHIEKIKATYLDIDSIMGNIIAYIEEKTNGDITFEKFIYPNKNFGVHKKEWNNKVIVGYEGKFSGMILQNKNNPLTRQEIYGSHLFDTGWGVRKKPIFYNPKTQRINQKRQNKESTELYQILFGKLETAGGGGGSKFSYNGTSYLYIESYKALNELHKKEHIKSQLEILKINFQNKKAYYVDMAERESTNEYNRLKNKDKELKTLDKEIKELRELLEQKEKQLKLRKMALKTKAKDSVQIKYGYKKNLILPKITKFQNPNAEIIVEAELDSYYDEALKFQQQYPELLI